MKRLVFGGAIASITVALPFSSCGGRIFGYLDDAGVYHAGDGAVLFVPGSACDGFDASHVADPAPACGFDADLDDAGFSAVCAEWPSVPPRFPWNVSACVGDPEGCQHGVACSEGGPGHCVAVLDRTLIIACPSIDEVGDIYCSAYAQQFAVTGKAFGRCDWNAFGTAIVCNWQTTPLGAEVCQFNLMAVTGTDAEVVDPATGIACRHPCEP